MLPLKLRFARAKVALPARCRRHEKSPPVRAGGGKVTMTCKYCGHPREIIHIELYADEEGVLQARAIEGRYEPAELPPGPQTSAQPRSRPKDDSS